MRERLKEPRKGSEIEPEIVCVQGVGAPHHFNQCIILLMFYVYVVHSKKLSQFYIGQTNDLKRRFNEHITGRSTYTKRSDDWELIYYESFRTRSLAMKRERKLKPRSRAFQELLKRIIDKSGEG